MSGVAFLPKEFRGTKERTGAEFPSHDICPLVDLEWKVTVEDVLDNTDEE
jgi:hypothetical protein